MKAVTPLIQGVSVTHFHSSLVLPILLHMFFKALCVELGYERDPP
jgi:hypothetical protein